MMREIIVKGVILLSLLFYSNCYLTAKPLSLKDSIPLSAGNFLAYSPGTFAPAGLIIGRTNKRGDAIYLSGRFNFQVFRKSQYRFDGSSVEDHNLNWYYTGEKKYSRWELHAGGMIQLFTLADHLHFKFMLGAGIEKPRYLYSFSNSSKFANTTSWVEFKELGHASFSPEAALFMFIDHELNAHIGVSTLHKKHERMIFLGIGFGI